MTYSTPYSTPLDIVYLTKVSSLALRTQTVKPITLWILAELNLQHLNYIPLVYNSRRHSSLVHRLVHLWCQSPGVISIER